jgi:DNA polymerase III subunit delta
MPRVSRAHGELKPAYAFWGEDRAKIDRTLRRLEHRAMEEGAMPPEVLDAAQAPAAEVVAACEALAFGGLRIVVLRSVEAWRAEDAAPLVAYLAEPNTGTCLVLVGDGAPTPKLREAVERVGEAHVYGPDPKAKRRDRERWFAEHFTAEVQRHGGKAPAQVAREVVARVGEDALRLGQEAEKLAAAAGGEPVGRELVAELVVRNPEARVYELSDAIVARDGARAHEVLGELAAGDDATGPIVVHGRLARHFRGVALAQSLGPDADADAVSTATGLRGYPAQKALEQARSLAPGVGDRLVERIARLELDLRVWAPRQLGRTPDDGERFVLELATRDLLGLARG